MLYFFFFTASEKEHFKINYLIQFESCTKIMYLKKEKES